MRDSYLEPSQIGASSLPPAAWTSPGRRPEKAMTFANGSAAAAVAGRRSSWSLVMHPGGGQRSVQMPIPAARPVQKMRPMCPITRAEGQKLRHAIFFRCFFLRVCDSFVYWSV